MATKTARMPQVLPSAFPGRRVPGGGSPSGRRMRRCGPVPVAGVAQAASELGEAERGRGHDPGVGCPGGEADRRAQPGHGALRPAHHSEDSASTAPPRGRTRAWRYGKRWRRSVGFDPMSRPIRAVSSESVRGGRTRAGRRRTRPSSSAVMSGEREAARPVARWGSCRVVEDEAEGVPWPERTALTPCRIGPLAQPRLVATGRSRVVNISRVTVVRKAAGLVVPAR